MPKLSTPLGFLPGEVDVGAHCMFVYPKRDDVFYDRIAGYLKAGLNAGEMCVCVSPMSAGSLLGHMQALGVDTDHAVKTGQLAVHGFEDVYVRWGVLDTGRVMAFWADKIEAADRQWNGMRIFGDSKGNVQNRTVRLKLLEYESQVNLSIARIRMSLCGYQSSAVPRTMLVQLKSVHPFLSSIRSIQTNHRYIEPIRFLNTFYRFQRISKIYPALARHAGECRRHFEEIAARTPMTMDELEGMKLAVGEAFVNALEHGCAGLPDDQCHIHVCYQPQPMGFTVEVRDHGRGFVLPADDAEPEIGGLSNRGFHLIRNLVSAVDVERRKDDTVVTLHMEYRYPFRN